MPLILAVLLYLLWHSNSQNPIFLSAFLAVLCIWLAYTALKDQRTDWNSLELRFEDGKLTRTATRYPVLSLVPSDVATISESKGGITIKTRDRFRTLFVSRKIVDYDRFRADLTSWVPTVPLADHGRSLWDYLHAALLVSACALTFGGPLYLASVVRGRSNVLVLGIVLFLSTLGLVIYVRRSPYLPITARNRIWFLLVLPILAVAEHLL